ncbi:uncharacterized protein [Clytia hemisphaerica]|uniref:uncharacterized protein n=1 Tax=Clytia hemisphaerica TaxID=252671 RepID=UPI0034D4B205
MNFYCLIALGVLFLPVPSSKKFVSGAGVPPVLVIPKFNYIYPEELNFPQHFQCVNNIPECRAGGCIMKWLVENNLLYKDNRKYLSVDNNKTLFIRAPISQESHKGPFACMVEKNKKLLGMSTGYLKFVTIPKKYLVREDLDGSTIGDVGVKKNLDIAGAFKDGKNVALLIVIFIFFFLSSLSWGLIIYFKTNGFSSATKDGYKLLEEQGSEEGEYEEVEDEYEEADRGKNKAKKEEKKEKKNEVKKGEKRKEEKKKEEKKKEDSSKKKREEKKKKQVENDPYYDEPYEEDYDTVKQRNE